jgi:hypothetical protein
MQLLNGPFGPPLSNPHTDVRQVGLFLSLRSPQHGFGAMRQNDFVMFCFLLIALLNYVKQADGGSNIQR